MHNVHRRALESQGIGGGGSDGKQQTTIHQKVSHPAAQRDAGLFSMLGNRFATHSNPHATEVIPAVPTITEDDQQPAGSAASAEQQPQAAQPGTGRPAQAASGTKREAWRTFQRHRQQRELTRHLPRCLRSWLQPDVEMSAAAVPDDAIEVNALCEEQIDQPDGGVLRQSW